MADRARQLALGVQLADYARFESYHAGENAEAVAHLERLAAGEAVKPAWIYGPAAVGKTHLLQAVCARMAGRAAYLPGRVIAEQSPGMIGGYERFEIVCIDDVEALLGDRDWETALFALCNALRDAQHRPLFSSRANPRTLTVALKDLRSRLLAGPVFKIRELDDAARLSALKNRATLRGFELPDETGKFLVRRKRRDMRTLCALLDELDRASLAAQRKLTIPFVKSILD